MIRARVLAGLLVGLAGPGLAGAAAEVAPGTYCPLPRKGEKPACLEPAQAAYGEFFDALDSGVPGDEPLARVERDLRAGSDDAYLALSSVAYGYFRLSQRAAAEGSDPALVARLERWNELLAAAYEESGEDVAFQQAVRTAAEDVQRQAPPVELRCVGEGGETTTCDSTDAVLRGIEAASGEVGLRGGLQKLLERIFGGAQS